MKFRFKYLVAGTLACLTAASPAMNATTWAMQADEPTLQSLLRKGQPTVGLRPQTLAPAPTGTATGPVRPVSYLAPVDDGVPNPLLPRVVADNSRPLVPVQAIGSSIITPAPLVPSPLPGNRFDWQNATGTSGNVPIISGPVQGQLTPNVPIITSPLAPNITQTNLVPITGTHSVQMPVATPAIPVIRSEVAEAKPAPIFIPPVTNSATAPSSPSSVVNQTIVNQPSATQPGPPVLPSGPAADGAIVVENGNPRFVTPTEGSRPSPDVAATPSVASPRAASGPTSNSRTPMPPDEIEVTEISSDSIAELMQAFGVSATIPAKAAGTAEMSAKNRVAAIGSGTAISRTPAQPDPVTIEEVDSFYTPLGSSAYDTYGLNLGYQRPNVPDRLPYDGYGTVSGASGYIFTDFLYMQRDGGDYSVSYAPQIDGYDFSPGVRLTMGRRWDSIEGYEVGVTLLETQSSHTSAVSPTNSLFTWLQPRNGFDATSLSSFNNASYHHSFHKGHYYSAEYNRMNWNWDVLSAFWGLRYTGIDELYALHSVGGGGDLGAYRLRARNHMVGPQLGGSLHYDIGRKLSFSLSGKLAGYANFYQTDTEFANNNVRLMDVKDSRTDLAWGAELGFFTHLSLSPRARIKGGWELWFYDRLATTQGQLDGFISPFNGTVAKNGDEALFYGFSLGLEWFR